MKRERPEAGTVMRGVLTVLAGVCLVVFAGCGSTATTEPATGSSSKSGAGSGAGSTTLTVFAAASLQTTFTALGKDFESTHPGTTVAFSFAGSSDLVTQLQSGARADVFASADPKTMNRATAEGLTQASPVDFASNALSIATPPDNPARIASFADLTRSGVKVVVCAPVVPCGAATEKVETVTGITLTPVSEEQSVTDVLNKVTTGEADAGLVYITDVKSAGSKVTGVAFPESSEAVNRYQIAPLWTSGNSGLASDFIALVTGGEGARALADAGFAGP